VETSVGIARSSRVAKASRERVFAAADEALRGGRRPTIEAIQARLGGGSPNGILAYLKEWYSELGERLGLTETPAEGLTPEVHRAALVLQAALTRQAASGPAGESTEALIRSLRAEVLSLQMLLDELRGQRGRDQQLLADARALLVRRDEDLQACIASEAALKSTLAVAEDRLRRRAAGFSRIARPRKAKAASRGAGRPANRRVVTTRKARSKAGSRAAPRARHASSSSTKAAPRRWAPARRRARSK
jgi:hypothetical protein